jgi:hypothetical protein
MVQHSGNRFTGARVEIDGQSFENCTFDRCAVIFKATAPSQFNGCTLNACSFGFEGPAAMTLKFMSDLYKIAPDVVEKTFDNVRLGM